MAAFPNPTTLPWRFHATKAGNVHFMLNIFQTSPRAGRWALQKAVGYPTGDLVSLYIVVCVVNRAHIFLRRFPVTPAPRPVADARSPRTRISREQEQQQQSCSARLRHHRFARFLAFCCIGTLIAFGSSVYISRPPTCLSNSPSRQPPAETSTDVSPCS